MSLTASSSSTSVLQPTNLSPEETDLWELCYYAGVTIDPQMFHYIVELLNRNVHPQAVYDVLKMIVPHSEYATKEIFSDKLVPEIKRSITKQATSHKQVAGNAGHKKSNLASKASVSNNESRKTTSVRSSSSNRQTSSKASKSKSSSVVTESKPTSDRSKSTITLKK